MTASEPEKVLGKIEHPDILTGQVPAGWGEPEEDEPGSE